MTDSPLEVGDVSLAGRILELSNILYTRVRLLHYFNPDVPLESLAYHV